MQTHLPRDTCPAQPYYCEENAWLRCRTYPGDTTFAVWITNDKRQVPMFAQRAAPSPAVPVVWDYHVIALVDGFVFDPDCMAGAVLSLDAWLTASFPLVVPGHDPRFRVVRGALYVEHFASDRSHMKRGDVFTQPPPPWPAIHPERESTLERYLDLTDSSLGPWRSAHELRTGTLL